MGYDPETLRARLRRRQPDREHPLRLPARGDLERERHGRSAAHPRHVVMLTCDAFGVLPPIARLTPAQAMYHFLSGFTAKVAGTETRRDRARAHLLGLLRRPLHAAPARGLRRGCCAERIARHGADLLAGQHRLDRRRLRHRAADAHRRDPRDPVGGARRHARARGGSARDPNFGFEVPLAVPGVDAGPARPALAPGPMRPPTTRRRGGWSAMFTENFAPYEPLIDADLREAALG